MAEAIAQEGRATPVALDPNYIEIDTKHWLRDWVRDHPTKAVPKGELLEAHELHAAAHILFNEFITYGYLAD